MYIRYGLAFTPFRFSMQIDFLCSCITCKVAVLLVLWYVSHMFAFGEGAQRGTKKRQSANQVMYLLNFLAMCSADLSVVK